MNDLKPYVRTKFEVGGKLTELLFDNLEDFLLVEFLWKTLNSSQGLTTISLC